MKRVDIIVPVAPFEPLSVIKRSAECIMGLETTGLDVHVVYAIDGDGNDDERLQYLRTLPVTVISRADARGRRAGAINDAIDLCSKGEPDYVALFDVDSRPYWNFLVECVKLLDSEDAIIASGARFITNEDENIITKTIAAEYCFFSGMHRFFDRFNGFVQFNGMIGVLNMKLMREHQLDRINESVSCEDLAFTMDAYLAGFVGKFAENTLVGEQAPSTLRDLYSQRLRWMNGAYQGLSAHLTSFASSKIATSKRLAWLLSLSIPFVAFLATPAVPIYGVYLCTKYGVCRATIMTLGLIGHLWLVSLCGAVVLIKNALGKPVEWKASDRSDI